MQGLQIGVVKQVTKDPSGEGRVFISLPVLQDPAKGVWAPLGTTFYGSNKIGAMFYPEVDDEVIVGFRDDDPRYPVILGSPIVPDEQNNRKALVTRSKLEITFDDGDQIIEIKTPGGHSIQLNDKSGSIVFIDSNGNRVSLAQDGITMESSRDVKIAAKGNVTIEAGGILDVTANSIEGL